MIRTLIIIFVLYLIFTMDFSCYKSFDLVCLEELKTKIGEMIRWFVDFIDNTFIPFVDERFEAMDTDKSLIGNLIE